MRDFWKRLLAVVLAVVMVVAALPAVELATAREVQADTIFSKFDPTLEFYGVKASTYSRYTTGANHYIKWAIANGSQALDDPTAQNYARGSFGSFYIDLAGAIDAQTSQWAQDNPSFEFIPLNVCLATSNGGKGYKLYYQLYWEGDNYFYNELIQKDAKVSGWSNVTYSDGQYVKGCEFKDDNKKYHSAGLHATTSDDPKFMGVESVNEGSVLVQDVCVELHVEINNTYNGQSYTGLYQTYYTNPVYKPSEYADNPTWTWYDVDSSTGAGTSGEYIQTANAVFKCTVAGDDGDSDIPADSVTITRVNDTFTATAQFSGPIVEAKNLPDGKVTSTKTFTRTWDWAGFPGKQELTAPANNPNETDDTGLTVGLAFDRTAFTPNSPANLVKNSNGNYLPSDTEHYTRTTGVVAKKESPGYTSVTATTTTPFGGSNANETKMFAGPAWTSGSTTATFTNNSDSNETYTVNVTEKNGKYVCYFCGLEFELGDAAFYADWTWHDYDPSIDAYTADYTIKSVSSDQPVMVNGSAISGTAIVTNGSNKTAGSGAEKNADLTTTLTASVLPEHLSGYNPDFATSTRTVDDPVWSRGCRAVPGEHQQLDELESHQPRQG